MSKEASPQSDETNTGPLSTSGGTNEAAGSPSGGGGSRPQFLNQMGGRAALNLQKAYDKLVAGRVTQLQSQVIEQDRELSDLAHDIAQLTAQIKQMNHLLESLDERLTSLETRQPTEPE